MSLVSLPVAAKDLSHHFDALRAIATGAWEDLGKLPAKDQVVMTPRTKSSFVHDYMVARAAVYCETVEGVVPFKKKEMRGIVIDGRYAIRFKKLDDVNQSKNQPTTQVMLFRSQITLDGIEGEHHLELGYVTNSLATKIADVRLVCPSGEKTNSWAISIGQSGSVKAVVEDLFQAQPDAEVEQAAIGPKKDKESKDGKVLKFKKSGHEG